MIIDQLPRLTVGRDELQKRNICADDAIYSILSYYGN